MRLTSLKKILPAFVFLLVGLTMFSTGVQAAHAAVTQDQINTALDGYSQQGSIPQISSYVNNLVSTNPELAEAMLSQINASIQEYNNLDTPEQKQSYLDALQPSLRVIVGSNAIQNNARNREIARLGAAALEQARQRLNELKPGLGNTLVDATRQSTTLASQVAQQQAQKKDQVDGIGCTISGAVTSTNIMAICVSNLVYYVMVGVFSSFAYIAAFFFDLAILLSLNSTTYALGFINTSWVIVRDLANMAFIFILIYIAVKVMLEADTSDTIKTLAMVVVVALLVNFSFFFTRVVIDAGNLLALQFYNAIDAPTIGQTGAGSIGSVLSQGQTNGQSAPGTSVASNLTALASAGNTKDLTASIMDGLQVQNILNSPSFKAYAYDPSSSSMFILISLSTIYIAVGIAFAIIAGAFLYAGAKFLMRIIGLWFLIIFSPLALVAQAVPQGKKLFSMWTTHLVNFTFYPAVFMFMFFILTKFMKELNAPGADGKGGGNFLSAVFTQPMTNNDAFGFLNILSAIANVGIRLGFVIGMIYLALSAADMLAKIRGDITTSAARKGAGWLGNAITGGAVGWAGRQTLGRVGRLIGNDRLANATYDVRNSVLARKTGVSTILRGFDPTTKTPHEKFGATPIDFGKGHVEKEYERKKAREEKVIEKEDKIAAERKKTREAEDTTTQTTSNKQKSIPAAPQNSTTPPNNPSPTNTGGGGTPSRNSPTNTQGATTATNQTQPYKPSAAPASNSGAHMAPTVDAANLGKILKQLNQDNINKVNNQLDTSIKNNMATLKVPPPQIVTKDSDNHSSNLSEEALTQIKSVVRTVIHKENGANNPGATHSTALSTSPTIPSTHSQPAGKTNPPPPRTPTLPNNSNNA